MSESDYRDICEQQAGQAMQATPHSELLDAIMDSRVPKSEREHAARREIQTIREAYDALWKEKELLLKVLKDWQEFAADVRAGDAAGQDWLDGLKARTVRIVDPCS